MATRWTGNKLFFEDGLKPSGDKEALYHKLIDNVTTARDVLMDHWELSSNEPHSQVQMSEQLQRRP